MSITCAEKKQGVYGVDLLEKIDAILDEVKVKTKLTTWHGFAVWQRGQEVMDLRLFLTKRLDSQHKRSRGMSR